MGRFAEKPGSQKKTTPPRSPFKKSKSRKGKEADAILRGSKAQERAVKAGKAFRRRQRPTATFTRVQDKQKVLQPKPNNQPLIRQPGEASAVAKVTSTPGALVVQEKGGALTKTTSGDSISITRTIKNRQGGSQTDEFQLPKDFDPTSDPWGVGLPQRRQPEVQDNAKEVAPKKGRRRQKAASTSAGATQESSGSGDGEAKVKKKTTRLPTVRRVVDENSLSFKNDRLALWDNTPERREAKGGYNLERREDYEYSVPYNGQNLVLNTNKNRTKFEGETILGIPSVRDRLDSIKTDKLINDIVDFSSKVEGSDISGQAPVAPEWKKSIHGKVGKDIPTRSRRGVGDYGGMQIHHVGQWAKTPFGEINGQLERGEIDLETAKAKMRDNLVWMKDGKKGEEKDMWRIDIKRPEDRELVILPGGLHDTNNKPLYDANHPMGVHPETGKMSKFGIPSDNHEYSRDWFNGMRDRFWGEYYRDEVKALEGELNRRIERGDITPQEAREKLLTSRQKQVAQQETVRKLREKREKEQNKAKFKERKTQERDRAIKRRDRAQVELEKAIANATRKKAAAAKKLEALQKNFRTEETKLAAEEASRKAEEAMKEADTALTRARISLRASEERAQKLISEVSGLS